MSRCSECGQEMPHLPKTYWAPDLGDDVWMNYPDGNYQGRVVGFVKDEIPRRRGQPIIERQEDHRGSPGLGIGGWRKGEQVVIHPMFLLPFRWGGEEYHRAVAEGRVG